MLPMPTLLLASKSPRRRQLLTQLGFPVRFVDVEVDEVVDAATPVELIPSGLALLKSRAYMQTLADDEVLVTADTIVAHRGQVLGKPHNVDEAVAMLRSLSDDSHDVYTGVCLKTARQTVVFTEKTTVWFRPLSEEVIRHYVSQGTCLDKAGSYGIQEWIGMVGVQRVDGCYYNVVGLPVSRLYFELGQLMRKS